MGSKAARAVAARKAGAGDGHGPDAPPDGQAPAEGVAGRDGSPAVGEGLSGDRPFECPGRTGQPCYGTVFAPTVRLLTDGTVSEDVVYRCVLCRVPVARVPSPVEGEAMWIALDE